MSFSNQIASQGLSLITKHIKTAYSYISFLQNSFISNLFLKYNMVANSKIAAPATAIMVICKRNILWISTMTIYILTLF